MSKRGKRGVSKCKKFTDAHKFTIEFNEDGLAVGKNAALFMSWVGIEFKKRIPYYELAKDVDKKLFDDIWEYIKVSWNIPSDLAKDTTLRKGKSIMKNFRHTLVDKYVKKNKSPFKDYEYLDRDHWDAFVAKASLEEYEVKSKKARMSARKNIEPARVGRMGFIGLMNSWQDRWNQLVSSYPHLSHIQDERSKLYAVSRAHFNPVTNLFELGPHLLSEGVLTGRLQELLAKEKEMMDDGTYYEDGKDVVTEVVGKGRQHGGRTRLVSDVIGSTKSFISRKKRKTKEAERLREEIDAVQRDQHRVATAFKASPCKRGSSCASSSDLPEIESITGCELTWPFDDSHPDLVLARGRVYPTSERILHGCPIANGFVKVNVDFVDEKCIKFPVLLQTRTDEIEEMGDTQGQFIQWPRKSRKILSNDSPGQSVIAQLHNVSQLASIPPRTVQPLKHSMTTPYRPELGPSYPLQSSHVDTNPTEPIHSSDADAKKPIKDEEKIASILKKIKKEKPLNIHGLAEKLASLYKVNPVIEFVSPPGMYRDAFLEHVEIKSLMDLCINEWADSGVLSLFNMYLYIMGGVDGKTAYFNPRFIELSMCKNRSKFVQDHIVSVMEVHTDKQYFMAPYLAGNHWSLIMISRIDNDCTGYIIDSVNKGKNASCYKITELFEAAVGRKIIWQMVNCHQQENTWECGYYVMKAMFDFVVTCNENLIMNDCKPIRQYEIEVFVGYVLGQFLKFTGI